ncbi:MAG: serine/threonine-protein kinase [Myxococcota bacterium]
MILHSGERLGQYRVDALIGEGGVSRVYAATHTHLGSRHAIKFLTFSHPDLEQCLMMEGRVQARLRHPHIVQVTDVVRYQERPGLVMEFVDGATLERWLRSRGAPPLSVGLDIFSQILSAVDEAHQMGVIHCDLKPANILMARTSHGVLAKVADFGIGQLISRLRQTDQGLNVQVGSPGYMAPEQIYDLSHVGPAADIFSLGAVLYEMLTGQLAFPPAAGQARSLRITLKTQPLDIRAHLPDCPTSLADAVMRSIARDPAVRFQSCAELHTALFGDRQMGVGPVHGWTAPIHSQGFSRTIVPDELFDVDDDVEDSIPTDVPPPMMLAPEPRSSRLLQAIGVGLLLAVVGLGSAYIGNMLSTTTPPASTSVYSEPIPPAVNFVAYPSPKNVVVEDADEDLPVDAAEAPEPPARTAPPAPRPAPVAVSPPAPDPVPEPQAEPVAEVATSTAPVEAPKIEAGDAVASLDVPEEVEAVVEAVVEAAVETPPAPVEAAPDLTAPDLIGAWNGTFGGRPFILSISSLNGTAARGQLRVMVGNAFRSFPVNGTFSGGALSMTSGRQIALHATYSGGQLTNGTLRFGRQEESGWTATR